MTGPATIAPEDLDAWRGHVGRTETRRQVLDIETLRRFAAAVGADFDVERRPPALAHWAYFLETAPSGALGPDGHPIRGDGLMPPVSLPRRMFAAAYLRFLEPLELGAEAQLTLTVADVRHRAGASGDLVFVDVDRLLTQGARPRLTERQTIVFRGGGEPTPPVLPQGAPPRADEVLWTPGPVELFRFSAATFNSHRIHYDLSYATAEEGYPALVVHGPFTAQKLATFAAARAPGKPLQSFSFRASAPLFAGQQVRLAAGAPVGEVQAIRCDGVVAMTGRGEFET